MILKVLPLHDIRELEKKGKIFFESIFKREGLALNRFEVIFFQPIM